MKKITLPSDIKVGMQVTVTNKSNENICILPNPVQTFRNDTEKGFNEAIRKVIFLAKEQAREYAELSKQKNYPYDGFHYKALAIIDFSLYLEQLFQHYVIESRGQNE